MLLSWGISCQQWTFHYTTPSGPFLPLFPLLLCILNLGPHTSHTCMAPPNQDSTVRIFTWEVAKQDIPYKVPMTNQSLMPSEFILGNQGDFQSYLKSMDDSKDTALKAGSQQRQWLPHGCQMEPLPLSFVAYLLYSLPEIMTPQPLLLRQKVNCQPAQLCDDLLQADTAELTEMEVVWLRQQSYLAPLNTSLQKFGQRERCT